MAFVSSSNNNTNSTNEAVNTAHGVSTASTQVNASYPTNIDNLSDVVICSFFSSQPNIPQLAHKDLVSNDSTCSKSCLETVKLLKSQYDKLLKDFKKFELMVLVRRSDDSPIIEDWVSDSEEENVSQPKIEKKIVKPSVAKIEFVKPKQQKKTRQNTHIPRGNQRNWNLVPRAVLMKSSLVSINTARQNISKIAVSVNTVRQVNTAHSKTTVNAARPMSYLSKTAHSTVKRLIHKNTTFKNSNIDQRVNTVSGKKFNTARPKAVVNVVKGNNVNAVKASACWVWKPKTKILDHVNTQNGIYSEQGLDMIVDAPRAHDRGTCPNLTDNEEIDWRIMLGHLNFKTMNKLVKGNLLLATKDETSGIFKSFITGIETLVDHKYKLIRCDIGTEFKNREMNQFCEMKGILRQFSVARTPQQNRVVERRNRTLIEAARTMLADSKLPTTFWVEAINTACYVQNRMLVVKPYNKTPYEVFHGRTPTLSFMRPFGCLVTILNTIDHLGKFDGKSDEGIRPDWLFEIDALTRTMNYEPIVACTQSNGFVGTKRSDNAGQARKETEPVKYYILLPLWTVDPPFSQNPKRSQDDGSKPSSGDGKKVDKDPRKDSESNDQEKEDNVNSTNNVNTVSLIVNAAGINKVNAIGAKTSIELLVDPNMPALEDYSIFDFSRDDEDDGAEADMNNLDTTIRVSPNLTIKIHKDHPLDQVIRDFQSAAQTRMLSKNLKEHGFVSTIQQRTNHKDLQNCLFACFLSQEEPKKVIHALKDPSWIEAMQEELLQFKLQEVWTLVDLPNGKRVIGSKWVFKNKKDEGGIVIRNKARLVAQDTHRK
ncbi:uncharacterized mitochondrial protein-like protein [Tanacetum coccineum]|uniref:Uncharacterized mitochondrial protein-like protein n=1 Tax=Tanacetum coccineum TaxID=301880 RepID=A0ABQ4WSK3_9ASTR